MSFALFVIWEIISQGPIKPSTFSHRSQVIFKDWLLFLWCCAYPLMPFILEQWNRLVWGFHVQFSENFFETQGQNACVYNRCWTTKLLSTWGPYFFVYPHFQKSKNTRLVSHQHLTKKLLFLPSKIGGRLIHGIDLYKGKYGTFLLDRELSDWAEGGNFHLRRRKSGRFHNKLIHE